MGPDTRQHILTTALHLFAASGYEGVGVAGLCEAAGITKPTLYHHCGSKRGVLEAIMATWGDPVLARLLPLTARSSESLPGDEIKLTLDRVTETLWHAAEENPDFYRLVLGLYHAPPLAEGGEVVRPFHFEVWRQLTSLFRAAATHHGAFRGREEVLAHMFSGMVHSWIGLFLAGGCSLDPPTRYRAMHSHLHGIFS